MTRALYQLLLWLALPFVPLRLAWRARREREYARRWTERFGRPPKTVPMGCIWFHAVSAGETNAVVPLISALADEFPQATFLITSMTPAGLRQARQRLGDKAAHCYAPYDFSFAVRAFFDAVRPKLLVLVETELWPNLIGEARRRGVSVLVINARLSARSARAYGRAPKFTKALLRAVDFIACQDAAQAQRFVTLGAVPPKVQVFGSVKFDAVLPPGHAQTLVALRKELGLRGRRVWIAASTHAGEDGKVLDAHVTVRRQLADACLMLVPRHPVRSGDVLVLAQGKGLSAALMSVVGREDRVDVMVCDRFGALQTLYGLSEVAFIGGSLVSKGGHNPIEAALCGVPLIMGPHTFNFAAAVAAFAEAGCLATVDAAASLAEAVLASLQDQDAGQATGMRAMQVVRENGGATIRLLAALRPRIQVLTASSD